MTRPLESFGQRPNVWLKASVLMPYFSQDISCLPLFFFSFLRKVTLNPDPTWLELKQHSLGWNPKGSAPCARLGRCSKARKRGARTLFLIDRLQTESGKNTAFKHSIVAQLYNIWIHKATKTSFPCITFTLFYKEYVNPLQPLRSYSALQKFFLKKVGFCPHTCLYFDTR